MSRLHYLTYNNYYNRLAKKAGDSINDYASFIVDSQDKNHNFNINDGVYAACTCNSWATYAHTPDYVIVTDNLGNLSSRWFVMEAQHMSGAQYKLTLRRDLIADFYDTIMNATSYVEKGYVDASNDLIFNTEALELNQIKQSETPLKDETSVSWAVAYIPDNGDIEKSITATNESVVAHPTKLSNWEFGQYVNKSTLAKMKVHYKFYVKDKNGKYGIVFHDQPTQNLQNEPTAYSIHNGKTISQLKTEVENYYANADPDDVESLRLASINALKSIPDSKEIFTNTEYDNLKRLNGQLILVDQNEDGTALNKYYRINVTDVPEYRSCNGSESAGLRSNMYKVWPLGAWTSTYHGQYEFSYGYNAEGRRVTLTLTEVSNVAVTIRNSGKSLKDQPYRMIAIPFKDQDGNGMRFTVNNTTYNTNPFYTLQILKQFPALYTNDLYSWQLLPYCPVRKCITDDSFNLSLNGTEGVGYELIKTTNNDVVGFVLYCEDSSFEFSIPYQYDITDYKIQSQTELMRLCSPNYNGIFEFNPAKNRGISQFNVTCTYKPVSPYIKVAPDFGGLYGQNFGDARGLICNGSFDLPQTSDAFIAWERTNSTYQEQFSRQIQHMETEKDISMKNAIWSAIAGTGTGITGGAAAGKFVGGTVGAGVGAAVGGILSGAAGIADVSHQKQLLNEGIDYTKDNFNFSLRNIQAIPDTLTKVSAYNADNKIFPFLELYDCTEVEKQAYRDKITYNGMSVNVIGKFKDFTGDSLTYVKGQVMRIDIEDDYHLVSEIYNEMNKGVYI